MQGLVTVYKNKLLQPVGLVKTLLESNGINCVLKGVGRVNPKEMDITEIELQVNRSDKDKAIKLIKEQKE